jgi:predicted ATP-dependent endonuclease of OLD family
MKISRIYISNFRCFENVHLELGNIVVLIGQNNAGKSSLLRAISFIQKGSAATSADIRAGARQGDIRLTCDSLSSLAPVEPGRSRDGTALAISLERSGEGMKIHDGAGARRHQCEAEEPDNCIVPYYSKRKIHGFTEEVRSQYARGAFNMNYLASKLSRITVPTFPGSRDYADVCEKILGFTLGAIPSDNGSRPGRYLPDGSSLSLEQMGDGVPSIVGLLIELITARNKIFLIEEPENDLHPKALKSLLEVILSSAKHNQIIVSTHSNIVLQYLGGAPGSIYEVTPLQAEIPTSSVHKVSDTSVARMAVLRNLGYTLADFDLWDGWIILEESSAERIIRDFLVPLFVPRLTSIRLLAANGVEDAEATFSALHRMVRFTHLEDTYRFTTWVRLDGDNAGQKIIERLRENYTQARQDQFAFFSHTNFEHYYPHVFAQRVHETLAIGDRQTRREAKKELLDDVISWLREDESRAKDALAESAAEIVEFLRSVQTKLP